MLSINTFEIIETICPWCKEYIILKITLGQTTHICPKCKGTIMCTISITKQYLKSIMDWVKL